MTFNLNSSFASLLHQGATSVGNTIVGLNGEFSTGVWNTVGVTWKAGEDATLYVDGVSVGTVVSTSCPDLGEERQLLFGGYDSEDLTDNAFTGEMDDIVIVDRKLYAAGMARLHWS